MRGKEISPVMSERKDASPTWPEPAAERKEDVGEADCAVRGWRGGGVLREDVPQEFQERLYIIFRWT